jgi:hypothetical protein
MINGQLAVRPRNGQKNLTQSRLPPSLKLWRKSALREIFSVRFAVVKSSGAYLFDPFQLFPTMI